ncbi:hypothetical protein D3C81_2262060 [compost metagenome]
MLLLLTMLVPAVMPFPMLMPAVMPFPMPVSMFATVLMPVPFSADACGVLLLGRTVLPFQ